MSEFIQDLIIAAWLGPGCWSRREWEEIRIVMFIGRTRGLS